jgi:hypothetical protein
MMIRFGLWVLGASVALITVSCSSDASRDAQAPSFKGCASAQALTPDAITVTWEPASDDKSPADKIVYEVFVSRTSPVDYHAPPWTFTNATSGTVTGLRAGSTYYVGCRARDEWINESAQSQEITVTTAGGAAGGSTFSSLLPILRDTCAGQCHVAGGVGGAGGLLLTESVAYKNLHDGKSREVLTSGAVIDADAGTVADDPPMPLVVPGDPEKSWLYQKLSYDPKYRPILEKSRGDFMPPPETGKLQDDVIQRFREWIKNGAKDD